jgi:hypothetical protein
MSFEKEYSKIINMIIRMAEIMKTTTNTKVIFNKEDSTIDGINYYTIVYLTQE